MVTPAIPGSSSNAGTTLSNATGVLLSDPPTSVVCESSGLLKLNPVAPAPLLVRTAVYLIVSPGSALPSLSTSPPAPGVNVAVKVAVTSDTAGGGAKGCGAGSGRAAGNDDPVFASSGFAKT